MGISTLLHGLSTKDPQPCDLAAGSGELSKHDLLLLRYQNGPNLGALFVQEKWIDNSLFKDDADGSSELAALESWGKHPDTGALQKKWEDHWKSFVTDQDFELMTQRGVTCVRLPIGFWSLSDDKLLKHTPFEKYAEVYKHSWDHVQQVIELAGKHGVGVLLDLHALPGGANGDEHSGTSSGKAELWEHSKYRDLAIDAYKVAIKKIKDLSNVVGLQLVNEAPYGESKCPGFYLDAASTIRSVDRSLPLIISDGWDCGSLVDKVKKWNQKLSSDKPGSTGFVVDTHVYRTFSDADKAKSADDHIHAAPNSVTPDEDVDIIVGEWSCCLDEQSWSKTQGDRGAKEAEFGKAQLQCFAKLAGNFFWTYKFGQGNGGSWDWRTMSEKGVVINRVNPGQGDLNGSLEHAINDHKSYWQGVDSKTDWEDWRFEDGFKQGWADAESFAQFDGSRPGLIAQLKAVRLSNHIKQKGTSDKVWVFGQAYVQGIRARVSA